MLLRKEPLLVMLLLLVSSVRLGAQTPPAAQEQASPCFHLEQAQAYQYLHLAGEPRDPRIEEEFRLALAAGKACPNAFLQFSWYRSRDLRFQEAADLMETYIKLEHRPSYQNLRRSVRSDLLSFREAARLQERVDAATTPELADLLPLIRLVDGYGEHKGVDAMPYAEQALALYPDSAEAILAYARLKLPSVFNIAEAKKVKQLLERAAIMAPENAEVYSTLGAWSQGDPVAEVYFQRALELSNKQDIASWKGLGYLYMNRGQKQEAIAAFRTCLRLLKAQGAPINPLVRDALRSLERSDDR